MFELIKRILGVREETPYFGDKPLSEYRPTVEPPTALQSRGIHVAFCHECKDEREFPLLSSECPIGVTGDHRCSDHSPEAFVHLGVQTNSETAETSLLSVFPPTWGRTHKIVTPKYEWCEEVKLEGERSSHVHHCVGCGFAIPCHDATCRKSNFLCTLC